MLSSFALSTMLCAQTVPAPSQASTGFIGTFQKHWTIAKGLALAVAEAMPAESYDFKPVPAEMSFGETMQHIAQANFGYCAFIGETKSPFQPVKDAKPTKASALKDLGDSFDYCTKTFEGLDETKLSQIRGTGERRFSSNEVMLGLMVHMSHHRGQAEVYLRLKGITPPEYKW
jgi:uncharacterized damage-inducible protein DinB